MKRGSHVRLPSSASPAQLARTVVRVTQKFTRSSECLLHCCPRLGCGYLVKLGHESRGCEGQFGPKTWGVHVREFETLEDQLSALQSALSVAQRSPGGPARQRQLAAVEHAAMACRHGLEQATRQPVLRVIEGGDRCHDRKSLDKRTPSKFHRCLGIGVIAGTAVAAAVWLAISDDSTDAVRDKSTVPTVPTAPAVAPSSPPSGPAAPSAAGPTPQPAGGPDATAQLEAAMPLASPASPTPADGLLPAPTTSVAVPTTPVPASTSTTPGPATTPPPAPTGLPRPLRDLLQTAGPPGPLLDRILAPGASSAGS